MNYFFLACSLGTYSLICRSIPASPDCKQFPLVSSILVSLGSRSSFHYNRLYKRVNSLGLCCASVMFPNKLDSWFYFFLWNTILLLRLISDKLLSYLRNRTERRPTTRAQPRFLISTQKNGKFAANYNYDHYNLPFSHIMIIVIISDEDILPI